MKRLALVPVAMTIAVSLACGSSTPDVKVSTPATSGGGAPTATVAPTEVATTESSSPGSSRANPAPLSSDVTVNDITLRVNKVTRPADDLVKQGNPYNATPEANSEYMLVDVTITCNAATSAKCSLFPANELKIVTTSGVVVQASFVAGMSGLLEISQELFGGAKVSGGILYLVPKGDTDLVLNYESLVLQYEAFLALK